MNINDLFNMLNRKRNESEWSKWADDNAEYDESRPKNFNLPNFNKLWIFLAAIFFIFAVILPWLSGFVTDLYWFETQGFESIFWKRLYAKGEMLIAAFIPAFLFYLANWYFAACKCLRLSDAPLFLPRKIKFFIPVAAAVLALLNAFSAMGNWKAFLQFVYSTPFGKTDPLFGIDIGFYIFKLPFIVFLRSWFLGVVFVAAAGVLAVCFISRAVTFSGIKVYAEKFAQVHLASLASLLLVLWGFGYYLERFAILYSPTGVVFGAGYTDVHVLLPALNVICIATFAAAILLLVNIFKPFWRISAVIVIMLFIGGTAAKILIPGVIQQYVVKPNEFELEKDYLTHSLECTRHAFGLDKVKSIQVTPAAEVTATELEEENQTVRDIRMWDYMPLLRTYRQLQAIRTYYNFKDVFIDRYSIEGTNRQVMLAVRELDLSKLQNPTWVNTHLEFTHGYGIVMNPVNEIGAGGMPKFFMNDIPAHSSVEIPLNRPEIYYGVSPQKNSYVLVKTDVKEFDYPMGDSNMRSEYLETGGVSIGSLWRRVLFALRFRDSEIIFTGALKPESRVIYKRNVLEAFLEVAPFLLYDADTYPVITDGRIVWVQDAFTWSQDYPYSQPFWNDDMTLKHFMGINYVRNSVKGTVDAYNGKMTFYIVDEDDPIVKTWAKIFPKLFKNKSEMSDDMWRHIRYPEDFFEVQTAMHTIYHMTDANTYYNREDVWEVTPVGREKRISPNYVTMKLWGEKKPEFAVMVPYMPLGRDNLIGWMAGRCDPENYGELLVYQFPKQKLIYGPGQVEALIDQNPEISAQLSLWSQRGSDVIRGDLLVVPIGKSLLYVQPLYLKAEHGELPELKRVIVSTGGRVAWGEDLMSALEKLMNGKINAANKDTKQQMTKALSEKAEDSQLNDDINALAGRAQKLFDAALNAQRSGNWAEYGEKIKQLGEVIEKMNQK